MYAGFKNHKTFADYKRDFEAAGGKSSDFVIRECWLAAISPRQAVSDIALARAFNPSRLGLPSFHGPEGPPDPPRPEGRVPEWDGS